MSESYPVTKEGYESLKTILRDMKVIERPKVIQAIAEARAHGDLSENAEYAAAKEKQAILESRIQDYENRVAISQVIDPATIREDKVVFGATVTFVDLDTEQEKTYKIVGDHEGDLKNGKISIQSPLARVMIGRRVGDIFDFQTANGLKELEITKLEFK